MASLVLVMSGDGDDVGGDAPPPAKKPKTRGAFTRVRSSRPDELPKEIEIRCGNQTFRFPTDGARMRIGARFEASVPGAQLFV
jgi:hypothetical protein